MSEFDFDPNKKNSTNGVDFNTSDYFANDNNSFDYFAAEEKTEYSDSAPAPRPARSAPKGLVLSIVGFVLGMLALVNGVSLLLTQYLAGFEEDYYKDRYSDRYDFIDVDQTSNILSVWVERVTVVLFCLAALIIACIALGKAKNSIRKKKVITFSALSFVGIAVGAISLVLSFTLNFIVG